MQIALIVVAHSAVNVTRFDFTSARMSFRSARSASSSSVARPCFGAPALRFPAAPVAPRWRAYPIEIINEREIIVRSGTL